MWFNFQSLDSWRKQLDGYATSEFNRTRRQWRVLSVWYSWHVSRRCTRPIHIYWIRFDGLLPVELVRIESASNKRIPKNRDHIDSLHKWHFVYLADWRHRRNDIHLALLFTGKNALNIHTPYSISVCNMRAHHHTKELIHNLVSSLHPLHVCVLIRRRKIYRCRMHLPTSVGPGRFSSY